MIRFHLESGARREGALNLTRRDLDPQRATIWLREKGGEREQPVSPTLVRLVERHATSRNAIRDRDAVFRTGHGQAMTRRRYSTIFDRARTALPWADRTPLSAHVLRHTAITAVGRFAGYPVAQAFAGHSPAGVTGRYLHATIGEVATAVAALTGEPHPSPTRPRRLADCGEAAVGDADAMRSGGNDWHPACSLPAFSLWPGRRRACPGRHRRPKACRSWRRTTDGGGVAECSHRHTPGGMRGHAHGGIICRPEATLDVTYERWC